MINWFYCQFLTSGYGITSHGDLDWDISAYETSLNETDQKISSIFQDLEVAIYATYYFIQSHLLRFFQGCEENIFSGRELTRTHNSGKPEDALEYAKFKQAPFKLSKRIEKQLTQKGYKLNVQSISSGGITLSPSPVDRGKCNGAVILFLKKSLVEGADLNEIATEFETGVPLEGVLFQELGVQKINPVVDMELMKAAQSPWEEGPARHAHILTSFIDYFNQDFSSKTDPITWINNHIQTHYQELGLNEAEKATLYALDSSFRYGTSSWQRDLLEIQGLEVEPTLCQVGETVEMRSPTAILSIIDDLKPGSYKLNFPTYDSWGSHDSFHTVGFVVKENGSTVFYDPNYSITEVKAQQRRKAVKKVFKRYTGYSTKGNNSLCRQIEQLWKGHANPSSSMVVTNFELIKIKVAS